MNNNRNPLPKADSKSQLQRKSITSFQRVLPVDQFVFRDERADDSGVDGSLEILIDECSTNMRAQVQLKSSHHKKARLDGIVTSPSIDISNFNYLLNGTLGLYVFYVEDVDKLFYEWATDENRRLSMIDSDWRSQGGISIPLKELNEAAIQEIYERIKREAEFRREILEALAHAPTNDNISLSINPSTLESENSVEIEKILNSAGMTLVAAGYSNSVLEKLNLISPQASTQARFKLINAYANYSTGRYQLALGLVAEAMISNGLKEEDQRFAEGIHLACQENLGIITSDQYFQEIEAKATGDEILHMEVVLQKLTNKFRSQIDCDEEALQEIQELKSKIVSSEKSSDNSKLGARVKYLEVMGFDAVREILLEKLKTGARKESLAHISLIDQISDLKTAFNRFEEWNKEADALIQDAIKVNHPIFVADAISTKAFISLMELISNISFAEFEELSFDQSIIQDTVLLILDWCKKAQEIYKQANMLEGEVRIQLIMAQAFEVMGQLEPAKKLAQGVLGKAKLLGYKLHIETANQVISEKTLFSKCIQNARMVLHQKQSDEYNPLDLDSEEDIQNFTDFLIETYKIPEERRKYVVIEALCMRDIAREKSQWCKYLEIQQNLTHTFSSETLYAEDPNRRVICSKFEYCVDNQSPDWIEPLKELKKIHCSNCLDRETACISSSVVQ
jgi:hypothetical protein